MSFLVLHGWCFRRCGEECCGEERIGLFDRFGTYYGLTALQYLLNGDQVTFGVDTFRQKMRFFNMADADIE